MNNRLSLSPASCLIRILLCVLALHFVAGIGFSAIARKTIKHRRTVAAKPAFQKAIVQTAVLQPAASMRTPRPLIDEQFVGELRRYACTRRAAASLISCLTAASPEAISRLNVSDVSDHEVRIAGKKFGVPAVARGVLAVHIHARLQAGARPDDALLSNAHCGSLGERCTPRTARRSIDDVARASGLMLWDERNTKDDHGDQQWLRRRGVSVSVVR